MTPTKIYYFNPDRIPFVLMMDNNELITQQQEVTRTNPFSNVTVTLPRYAGMVYDKIKTAEVDEEYDIMQKGLDWFSRNFTDQYYTLLD
jgi:hypothetical protein|tara:strand:- start:434 stop:700 length:267 start_codon:yes stop_codon:yes gene_type:complete